MIHCHRPSLGSRMLGYSVLELLALEQNPSDRRNHRVLAHDLYPHELSL